MPNDLNISLQLDIKPAIEALKSFLNIAGEVGKQAQQLFSATSLKPNFSGIDGELTTLDEKLQRYAAETAKASSTTSQLSTEETRASNSTKMLGENISQASGFSNKFQQSMQNIFFTFGALQQGMMLLRSTLGDWIHESNVGELAEQKLDSALKAQGITSKSVSSDMKKYSDVLSNLTGYERDSITQTQAMLVAYTGLTGSALKPATRAVADLAAATGIDMVSSAQMLGRVVEFGSGRLGKLKVDLTHVKDETERWRIVLDLINKHFNGFAEDMGNTGAGQMMKFQNSITMLKESLGDLLKSALIPLLDILKPFILELRDASDGVKILGVGIASLIVLSIALRNEFGAYPYVLGGVLTLIAAFVQSLKEGNYVIPAIIVSLGGLALAITSVRVAVKGFFADLGPVGWAILGITTLAEVFGLLKTNTDLATDSQNNYNKSQEQLVQLSQTELKTSYAKISNDILEQQNKLDGYYDKIGTSDKSKMSWVNRDFIQREQDKIDKLKESADNMLEAMASQKYKKNSLLHPGEGKTGDSTAQDKQAADYQKTINELKLSVIKDGYLKEKAALEQWHEEEKKKVKDQDQWLVEEAYNTKLKELDAKFNSSTKKIDSISKEFDLRKKLDALLHTTSDYEYSDLLKQTLAIDKENVSLEDTVKLLELEKKIQTELANIPSSMSQVKLPDFKPLDDVLTDVDKKLLLLSETFKTKFDIDANKSIMSITGNLLNLKDVMSSVKDGFAAAAQTLAMAGSSAVMVFRQANSVLQMFINTLIQTIAQELILKAVMAAFAFVGLSGGGDVASAAGHASGGHIDGPGTETSDSIPAMLSKGEYVINAKSASQHRPLLDAINFGSLKHFASGGATTNNYSSTLQPITLNLAPDVKLGLNDLSISLKRVDSIYGNYR